MEYTLPRLVDITKLRTFTDLWYKATEVPLAVIDPQGSMLAVSGGREICLHFCRLEAVGRDRCGRSDAATGIMSGQGCTLRKCRKGLMDASAPIKLFGEKIGDFVAGPFLLHPPDLDFFKKQALQLGLDESLHIDTVSKVPVADEEKLQASLQGLSVFSEVLFEAGIRTIAGEKEDGDGPEERRHTLSPGSGKVLTAARKSPKERKDLEQNIIANVKMLILPYLEKLKKSGLTVKQTVFLDILETNLKGLTSPIINKIHSLGLTAGEIAVASLLREGKTTKQISELLNISLKAVEFHRHNIRKKLGLTGKKANLTTHLMSIT